MILVTGSSGLIGREIVARLRIAKRHVIEFDLNGPHRCDLRDVSALTQVVARATGIIHLAAISRVVWAEKNTTLTQAVNVAPLDRIAAQMRTMPQPPWLIFASSREVYGECAALPVREDAPLNPLNVYGRSKQSGETIVSNLACEGYVASICRFSNVYGSVYDHPDRVVPAFARAAAQGGRIRIDGSQNLFDFTYVQDVADGLGLAVEAAEQGKHLPPIHFVSGRPCSLGELAQLAASQANGKLEIEEASSRTFDVSRFYGDPTRARALFGWEARVPIEEGVERLIAAFKQYGSERLVGAPLVGVRDEKFARYGVIAPLP